MQSSIIVFTRQDSGMLKVRELHIDVLGREWEIDYRTALDTTQAELDANLAQHAIDKDNQLAAMEVHEWITDMDAGNDPAHIDMGGWFEHSVPNFNTWEDAVKGAVTPFLQDSYMQTILKCSLTWGRLTKAEGEAIAGKNNDVSSEIAIATNTQVELDSYVPLIDEDGAPRL